jgi:F0F1-type ATP synthase assembly protein I
MKNKPSDIPPYKNTNAALKYTGLAFQMLAVIGLGVFAGIQLDRYFRTPDIFTVILSLLGVVTGIYLAIRDFIRPKKK